MSDSLHDAIRRAMDAGQLHYCQDVIGEITTAPGRGVMLALLYQNIESSNTNF